MAKRAALGTKLLVSDMATPTPVWTAIANVGDLPFPNITRDDIDVTDHDSPGGYEETILGIKRSGNIQFTIHYDPSAVTHTTLKTLLDSGDKNDFRIEMNDIITPTTGNGTRWNFSGMVKQFAPSAPVNGAYTASVQIKVSGQITVDPAV